MESLGVLILRLTFGIIFTLHGLHQFFGWFGGGTMPNVMDRLGFRPPRLWASLCGLGNLVAGVMLALGALTFLGCALLITVMLVALIAVKLEKGFWERDGGYEYNLAVIGTAVAIGVMGPGPLSVDAVLMPALVRPEWFPAALILCLGVAAVGFARRRRPLVQEN